MAYRALSSGSRTALSSRKPAAAPEPDGLSVDDLAHFADAWIQDGQIRMLSRQTLATRRLLMDKFLWFLREERKADAVGRGEVRAFMSYVATAHERPGGRWGNEQLTRKVKPSTQATYFTILRTFFRFLVEEGAVAESPVETLRAPVVRDDQVTPFTPDQQLALLAAAKRSKHPKRDEALLLFLLDTGARASEATGLLMRDLNLDEGWALVDGKGGKRRKLHLSRPTRKVLAEYLRRGGREENQPVFLAEGGHLNGDGLTRSGLTQLVVRLGEAAGVEGARCSPHTFRHTFAYEFLRGGGKQFALMEMLGHTSMTITKRYVALVDADMQVQHRDYSPVERLLKEQRQRR
jgi:integrase/recombinase XerC/integrase/recombinase XerD